VVSTIFRDFFILVQCCFVRRFGERSVHLAFYCGVHMILIGR